jgi:preprotein translocase subunit SecE
VAKETRSTRRQKREAGAPTQGVAERARERRRRVKPVAETKAQTGQKQRRGGGGFIRESYAELRKVEWPNQRQLVSATAAVIVAVAVVGFFLWVADEAFSRFVRDVLLKL